MPRTAQSNRTVARTRRRGTAASATRGIVDQITQLVGANETLQRENQNLVEENRRLRGELVEIGSALGRLTGGPRTRRARRGAEVVETLAEAKPRRQRRPITDPVVLEKRRQALARARAARAERIAAARAARAAGDGATSSATSESAD